MHFGQKFCPKIQNFQIIYNAAKTEFYFFFNENCIQVSLQKEIKLSNEKVFVNYIVLNRTTTLTVVHNVQYVLNYIFKT